MTYDYSLGFLQRNAEMVAKLIKVANTGELLVVDFDDWAKLRYYQQQVHSLLANISKNVEDYGDIRQKVRCWTEHLPNELMRLNIGVPRHKVTGRAPGLAKQVWQSSYVPAELAAGHYVHDAKVKDGQELQRFTGKILDLPREIMLASARFEGVESSPEQFQWFNETYHPIGWTVRSIDNGTLTLARL